MADSYLGLTELLLVNDMNLADIEVTDLLDEAPFLKWLAADESSNGTQHKYLKETGAPVVGFRDPNTGRENKKSADTLVTITLKILDASFAIDKAVADAYKRGAMAYVAREARRHLKAAFFEAEQQLINGTGNLADGFDGLIDAATIDALADDMVIDAGGTTANTASSVYLVRSNGDGRDVTAITNGVLEIGDTVTQAIEDTVNGGRFTGYYTPIETWMGLQIGSAYSIGRIVNLTEDAGKGLTDDLIYDALATFPASRQPNGIVMNRRSLKQLRQSRTATNATGTPAPRPTEVDGIPIINTDAILNTESLVA